MRVSDRYPLGAAPCADETAITFGLRVLRLVLETGVPSAHDTAALEAADHAYPAAIAGQTDPRVCDHLTAARHAILATLRVRAQLDQIAETPNPPAARHDDAPTAPVPVHPAPANVPPAPAYADRVAF